MRLAICTLSAALLSGCSWLGLGGSEYGAGYSASGAYDCGQGAYQGGYSSYGQQGAYGSPYGQGGCDVGYGAGAGYGAASGYGAGAGYGAASGYGAGAGYGAASGYGAGAGYGAASGYGAGAGYGAASGYGAGAGYGAASGYGAGAGYGAASGYGAGAGYGAASGYGAGAGGAYGIASNGGYGAGYGVDGVTGQAVPLNTYGTSSAYGGGYGTVAGGQYGSTGYLGNQVAGGAVQQIQGAPIYVPQPYPAYYQAPRLRLGGSALPFGLAALGGASTFTSGELFQGAIAKPVEGSTTLTVSALEGMDYSDAFDSGKTIGGTAEYDLSPNRTAFASIAHTKYEGQTIQNGTITDTTTSTTDNGFYSFSDLEETTLEAGLRQYVGSNSAVRPYVSASAGAVRNNDVILSTSTDGTVLGAGAPFTQTYIHEGWAPTAAGLIGAEMEIGGNAALGVETGLRWAGKRDTNLDSDNTLSVPVQVRGRLAF